MTDTARRRARAVLEGMERLLAGLPVPTAHRDLLRIHVGVVREQAEAYEDVPALYLPATVCEAAGGDPAAGLDAAVACALVYSGADLLDNAADGELPEAWAGWSEGEITLAATTLIAPLPQLAIARGAIPAEAKAVLAEVIADGLLTMSAGQFADIGRSPAGEVTSAGARLVAEQKAGGEFGMLARAGAIAARAPAGTVDAYGEFGRAIGAAWQIGSDLADLFGDGPSQDLLNRKGTVPIAHALARDGSDELRALLARARHDPGSHDEVRARLTAAGSVVYSALIVGTYARRAREALDHAGATGPAGAELSALVAQATLSAS